MVNFLAELHGFAALGSRMALDKELDQSWSIATFYEKRPAAMDALNRRVMERYLIHDLTIKLCYVVARRIYSHTHYRTIVSTNRASFLFSSTNI